MNEPMPYAEPDIYNVPPQSMMDQGQSEGALIFQLDADEIISQVKHNLSGDFFNEKTTEWINDPKQRVMNETGISRIMSELRARLSKNTFLSNLPDELIEKRCITLHMQLTKLICLKFRDWEMDKTDIESTVYRIMDIVEIGLRRASNKTTLNYLRPQLHIAESMNPHNQPRKKVLGIF